MTKRKSRNAPGQGRPKLPYETTQIRVPVPLVEDVKTYIKHFKNEKRK